MSHEDIALIWSVLYGREDINKILVEAIGSHTLNVRLHRGDPERLRKVLVHHVLNLKVIYDLQRNYLQSSPRTSKTLLCLLRREVLLSSIVHLLDVTAEALSLADGSPTPVGGTLYAQTLLSALRALSLQDGNTTEREHELLDRRFDETFTKRYLDDLSNFTINSVCRRIIKDLLLGTEPKDLSTPACGVTTLPDFSSESVSPKIFVSLYFAEISSMFWNSTRSGQLAPFEERYIHLQHHKDGYGVYWSCTTLFGARLQPLFGWAWSPENVNEELHGHYRTKLRTSMTCKCCSRLGSKYRTSFSVHLDLWTSIKTSVGQMSN